MKSRTSRLLLFIFSFVTSYFPYFKLVTLKTLVILCNTLKKEGRAFRNIGKNISLYCVIFVYYIVNLEVAVGNTFLDFVFGIWAYAENVLFIGFSAFSCWTPGRPWHSEGQKGSREVWFVTQCSLQNKLCDKLKTESYVSTTPTRLRKAKAVLYIENNVWHLICYAVKISLSRENLELISSFEG